MYDRLIDNYTDRATKNMGRKERDDMRKELKSHIMDSAEALAAKQNKPVDETIVREVLAKMGPPEDFAASGTPAKKSIFSDRLILAGIAIFVVFFIIVGGLWVISALAGQGPISVHRMDNTSHAAAGNVSIDLDDFSGRIDVVESATNDIAVIYNVHGVSGSQNSVSTNTTYVQEGDTLKVTSWAKEESTGIFGHIHVGLYISPSADVVVKVPRNSRYDLDLKTSNGDVTVTALNGSSMTLNCDAGDIEIDGGVFDRIGATTSLGSIKASYDAGTATFESDAGSIDLDSDGAGDSLTATTSMGHIIARYSARKATFKSDAGSIDLDSSEPADSVSAATSMGSINAKYNASKATFRSDSGSIDLDSYGTAGSLTATTSMGSINVAVPEDTLFSADASTSMGRINHDTIPMVMTTADGSHLVGYTKGGEGNLKMDLKASTGSIEISY